MDMYDSLFSPGYVLNEQIAREVFDILPEQGPMMVIMDRDGNCWPSDSDRFSSLNISELWLQKLCARVDDGSEPIISQLNDCSVVAAQLTTGKTNCGYLVILLPHYTAESTLSNIELIEIVLNQSSLIAKLIEKNNLLYELQTRQFSLYGQADMVSN